MTKLTLPSSLNNPFARLRISNQEILERIDAGYALVERIEKQLKRTRNLETRALLTLFRDSADADTAQWIRLAQMDEWIKPLFELKPPWWVEDEEFFKGKKT